MMHAPVGAAGAVGQIVLICSRIAKWAIAVQVGKPNRPCALPEVGAPIVRATRQPKLLAHDVRVVVVPVVVAHGAPKAVVEDLDAPLERRPASHEAHISAHERAVRRRRRRRLHRRGGRRRRHLRRERRSHRRRRAGWRGRWRRRQLRGRWRRWRRPRRWWRPRRRWRGRQRRGRRRLRRWRRRKGRRRWRQRRRRRRRRRRRWRRRRRRVGTVGVAVDRCLVARSRGWYASAIAGRGSWGD